jgi:protein-disulfide isomerase
MVLLFFKAMWGCYNAAMPARTKKEIIPAAESDHSEDTVTFKRSYLYSVLVVLAFSAGILVGYAAWGNNAGAVQTSQTANQSSAPVIEAPVATEELQYVRYDVFSEDAYAFGPEDAPITIVEFGDFQCPFCRRWHAEVYQPLLASYPGQIRMVYRHLPLTSIHPDAFAAAEAAMCAGEQDAFWQYNEKLFSSETLGTAVYAQYAQELNLDMTAFEACMTEHRYQQAIQKDSDFAVDLGIRSTPTFFINGLAIVGAQPLNVFQQVIDKELVGEIPTQ